MAGIERLLARTRHGELLGGLLWRAPSPGKSRLRALREAKLLTADATHVAQAQVGDHLRYGMYQPRASEEGTPLPRTAIAAAACFARLVGAQAPNAALVLTVAPTGQRKEEKYFVVCLEDGVPVVDVLSNEIDARNALGAEDRPIWSDNPVAYPNCAPADFDWLAGGAADRGARVQRIPLNPWPLALAAAATVLLAGGWSLLRHLEARRAQEAAAAAARAADPVPRYLSALAAQAPRMATDRGAVAAAAAALFASPVRVPGWRLAAAACDAAQATCVRDWQRVGGTFDDLRRALPGDALEPRPQPGAPIPGLDVARTSHRWRAPRVDLRRPGHPLLALPGAIAAAGPLLQVWRTADVLIDFKAPQPWPRVADLPRDFRDPRALLAGDVHLHDVPGPFIVEALRGAPDFISWESVRVEVGEGTDTRGLLRFSASGTYYVAAR